MNYFKFYITIFGILFFISTTTFAMDSIRLDATTATNNWVKYGSGPKDIDRYEPEPLIEAYMYLDEISITGILYENKDHIKFVRCESLSFNNNELEFKKKDCVTNNDDLFKLCAHCLRREGNMAPSKVMDLFKKGKSLTYYCEQKEGKYFFCFHD